VDSQARLAEKQAETARRVAATDPRLDFSLDTLEVVDEAVRGRSRSIEYRSVAAYLGEVILRAMGNGRWMTRTPLVTRS
jgi:hypothetical protein